jgi:hypothetical protein
MNVGREALKIGAFLTAAGAAVWVSRQHGPRWDWFFLLFGR